MYRRIQPRDARADGNGLRPDLPGKPSGLLGPPVGQAGLTDGKMRLFLTAQHISQSILMAVTIAPDFFEVVQRPADWPDDPDLRRAVDWLLSFVPDDEWKRRRFAALEKFVNTASGERRPEPDEKGRFFDEEDRFAWYLFLGQALLDHPMVYDFVFGARVVPVFRAIGRNLNVLRGVRGIEARVKRMTGPERGQPNGGLFELLVAAAYRRAGATVSFLPEQPGVRKTHDLDVELRGTLWAVECKRLEVGEYAEKERAAVRSLWVPVSRNLHEQGLSVMCKARFLAELDQVPQLYLATQVRDWLRAGRKSHSWSDGYGSGQVSSLDLAPLQAVLATDNVAMNSPRLQELLTGEYKRNGSFVSSFHAKRADNPLYMAACDQAIVLDWESRSSAAIDGRARDVLKRLADGNRQLPSGRRGVIHIGFEAVDGMEVEQARYEKVQQTLRTFDPGEKQLEYVYVSWLAPECPPDGTEGYDETCHWQAVRATGPRPLIDAMLILPPGTAGRPGVHWTG